METKINEADSEIDVQLVKRRDLLVKLISTVKQEMTFEKELLTNVTKMRSQHLDGLTVQEKSAFNQQMDQVQRGINVQLEAYPNIKSLTNVLQLQNAISDVEEDIAAARRIYNSNVSFYNQDLQTYPMSVAANGLITKPFFEASEKQREDVEINLI
jgi:LemA protein